MKTIYLTLLSLLVSTLGFTQDDQLSAKIIDEQGYALERACVLVLNADDMSYVTGAITDEFGDFEITSIEKGNYILTVDHVSFQQPKIFGSLNTQHDIDELDKLNLSQLGAELVLETTPSNYGTVIKF